MKGIEGRRKGRDEEEKEGNSPPRLFLKVCTYGNNRDKLGPTTHENC